MRRVDGRAPPVAQRAGSVGLATLDPFLTSHYSLLTIRLLLSVFVTLPTVLTLVPS